MFTNLTHEDKQAFFGLLDEYFESRPHLAGARGAVGGATLKPTPPAPAYAAASNGTAARSKPPPPPTRPYGNTSYSTGSEAAEPTTPDSPMRHSPAAPQSSGQKTLHSATRMMNSGMNKVTSNSHVSSALGKVGAGSLVDKFNKPAPSPRPAASPISPASPVRSSATSPAGGAPPRSSGLATAPRSSGPSGLTSGKSFGHMDTSSTGAAFKTMFHDPKKTSAPVIEHTLPPALGTNSGSALPPPPSRRDGTGSTAAYGSHELDPEPAAPAKSSQARVQAIYDYLGGDDTDLPLLENQIAQLVEKTSDDWWTCEDDNGQRGLVPANYLKEL